MADVPVAADDCVVTVAPLGTQFRQVVGEGIEEAVLLILLLAQGSTRGQVEAGNLDIHIQAGVRCRGNTTDKPTGFFELLGADAHLDVVKRKARENAHAGAPLCTQVFSADPMPSGIKSGREGLACLVVGGADFLQQNDIGTGVLQPLQQSQVGFAALLDGGADAVDIDCRDCKAHALIRYLCVHYALKTPSAVRCARPSSPVSGGKEQWSAER